MITLPPPREDELVADALEVFFDIEGGKFTYDLVDIALAHVQRENRVLGNLMCIEFDGIGLFYNFS